MSKGWSHQPFVKLREMKGLDKLISFQREFIIYLFPPILIVAFYLAFHSLTIIMADKEAFLLGMALYWLVGCLAPAFLWMSKTNRKLLLRVRSINWWQFVLLLLPVVLAFLFGPLKHRLNEESVLILALALPYALVNAFCEEYLWRGLFYVHHQGNFFHAVIVPSIWFGIWYYVPLSLFPAPVGNFYFILGAVGLGVCCGTVTYYTRSIFWSIICHTLFDFFGVGVVFYLL
jgi:membrane protease YdiL (CAAX protease family)